MDSVLDDVRHNARLEAQQHEAFLESETAFFDDEHADAIETANREMQLLWGRFRSVLLVFVACLLLTTAVHGRGSRQLASHASNQTTAAAFARADRGAHFNVTRHHGLRDPYGAGYERHVAGTWERLVHFLFLVLLLRLAALRQRQTDYERALADDDPFGLHATHPFVVREAVFHHWQPMTSYRDLDAEMDAENEQGRRMWWHRAARDSHGQRRYYHHDDFV